MSADATEAVRPMGIARFGAEAAGTAFLLVAVVGSGIMAERLAGGNVALALLANAIATGAALYVLISIFGPVSGAQFNPAVSFALTLTGRQSAGRTIAFIAVQIAAGIAGVLIAHAMFDLPLIQTGIHPRGGTGQWIGEAVATFGLVMTILGCIAHAPARIAPAVALYITGAYWFTSSTSFANPAVTVARAMTESFSGIVPGDAPAFIACQFAGAAAAVLLAPVLGLLPQRAAE